MFALSLPNGSILLLTLCSNETVIGLAISYSLMGVGGNVLGLGLFSRACLFHGQYQATVVSLWVAACNSGPLVFFWFGVNASNAHFLICIADL